MTMVGPVKFDTPVLGPEMVLEPEWIDFNDHLNMAYYNVIFDRSVDVLVDILGINEAYRLATNRSVMTAEAHVVYVSELLSDARVRVAMRLIDADEKRLHVYQELYHVDGWLAATSEVMILHVDLGARKVTAFPDGVMSNIRTMLAAHQALPPTRYMGRTIGIRRG